MKILSINCGSSSLRVDIFDALIGREECSRLTSAHVKKFGDESTVEWRQLGGGSKRDSVPLRDHKSTIQYLLSQILKDGLLDPADAYAVGHRIVHGGERFTQPTVLNEDIIESLAALGDLAPLHHGAALEVIRATRNILDPATPMVAVFDTTFHRTLPRYAKEYAIPAELTRKYAIQRYGFHGLAHRSMSEKVTEALQRTGEPTRVITLQLGNGCSAAAIRDGASIDTSMGFTPLEGLMMGSRSGDLDPFIVPYLAGKEQISCNEVVECLNRHSGLLGVSENSTDMRELLELEQQGDTQASLAIRMFCYRVQKYIGAYMAILGGVDAIVFGGGIGENAPTIRARICAGFEWCGLHLEPEMNQSTIGNDAKISNRASAIEVHVLPPDEAHIIALDTAQQFASS